MLSLRDITLGQYLPGSSPVHRIDPRAKFGACLVAMAAVFVPGPDWGVAWAWPLLGTGVLVSGISPAYFLRGFRPFGWLFLFTVVLHALTTPGRAVAAIPGVPLAVTAEGLSRGGAVVAQLATAIGFSSLLTLTTSPTDLVWAMERMGAPLTRLGVPVGDFCITTLLAIRFFPILHQEAERLVFALRARGMDPTEGGAARRIRSLAPLLIPLLRQVFHRAETLALAMELRGYRPGVVRTSWRARGVGGLEMVTLGLAAATAGAAWAWSRGHGG